jgi:hypothetical protein
MWNCRIDIVHQVYDGGNIIFARWIRNAYEAVTGKQE